jgi:hypothetical protein
MSAALPVLTELEKDVLDGIYRSEYTDGGIQPAIWSWSIACRKATTKQVSGVVSSLVKKGVVTCGGAGTKDDDATVDVTDLGVEVARSLGFFKMYDFGEGFNADHDEKGEEVTPPTAEQSAARQAEIERWEKYNEVGEQDEETPAFNSLASVQELVATINKGLKETKAAKIPVIRGRTISFLESVFNGADIESVSMDLDMPVSEVSWYLKDFAKRGLIVKDEHFNYRLTERGKLGLNAAHLRMLKEGN